MMDLKKTALGIELGSTRIKAVLIDEKHIPVASGDFEWENQYVNGVWTYPMDAVHSGVQACFADLKKGCFGIDEPDPLICSPVEPVSDSLCFVPGLAFDEQNYRIGFGKGYYDKFLGNYRGITAGICPEYCMAESLPHEEHDRAVDYVITDRKIRKRMISDD